MFSPIPPELAAHTPRMGMPESIDFEKDEFLVVRWNARFDAFPTFAESMVGRVIFAVAGNDWKHALTLTDKAYSHSLSPATTRLVEVTEKSATFEFRDVWNFCDCYQIGVFEGAMAHYKVNGSVTLRAYARPCDVDLLLRWD